MVLWEDWDFLPFFLCRHNSFAVQIHLISKVNPKLGSLNHHQRRLAAWRAWSAPCCKQTVEHETTSIQRLGNDNCQIKWHEVYFISPCIWPKHFASEICATYFSPGLRLGGNWKALLSVAYTLRHAMRPPLRLSVAWRDEWMEGEKSSCEPRWKF